MRRSDRCVSSCIIGDEVDEFLVSVHGGGELLYEVGNVVVGVEGLIALDELEKSETSRVDDGVACRCE